MLQVAANQTISIDIDHANEAVSALVDVLDQQLDDMANLKPYSPEWERARERKNFTQAALDHIQSAIEQWERHDTATTEARYR